MFNKIDKDVLIKKMVYYYNKNFISTNDNDIEDID